MSEEQQATENPGEAEALLTPIEARVLGCLMEKAATTPETYPLTENATLTACNQKSNREPVMKLEMGRVGQALRQLERKELVRAEHSARALRFAHTADQRLAITPQQRALLCLLLLRGPQTVGELLTRTARMTRFEDIDEVRFTLERMMQHDPPLTVLLGRAPGQREDRYMHLLCGPVDEQTLRASHARTDPVVAPDAELIARIEALEARVAALEGVQDE